MVGKKVAVSGVVKVAHLALGLVASICAARWLGPELFGRYSYVIVLATVIAVPVQLGWPTLLIREIAKYSHGGEHAKVRGILRMSARWAAGSSFLGALACLGLGALVWRGESPLAPAELLMGALLVPVLVYGGFRKSVLAGLDAVIKSQLLDGVLRPIVLLGALVALHLAGSLNEGSAVAAQLAAAGCALAYGTVAMMRTLHPQARHAPPDDGDSPVWRASILPLTLVASAQAFVANADVLVLGFLVDAESVGQYKVAVTVATQVAFASWLVNAVFAPSIVRFHRSKDTASLNKLMRKGRRYTLMVAVPAFLAVAVFGDIAIVALLGPEYMPAYLPMVIIALGQLLGATAGPVGLALSMTGHERRVARVLLFSAAANVLLTVLLSMAMGMSGAAVASAFSFVMTRVWMLSIARKLEPGII